MSKAMLREALAQHLRLELRTKTDYDTYGSSTDLHVRLLWVDEDGEVELAEGYEQVAHERRGG